MNVLEKILEEIEEATFQEDSPLYLGDMEVDGYVRASRVKEIILSHINDTKDRNIHANDEPYMLFALNENGVAEEYDDTYDITIHCESEEEQDRVSKILENYHGWIPVDSDNQPKDEERVLVSFENFNEVLTARYKAEEEEGGTFLLDADDTDESFVSHDLYVSAWQSLPDRYKGE